MNMLGFAVQNASPDERTLTGRLLWFLIKCYAIVILLGIAAIPVGIVAISRYESRVTAERSAFMKTCTGGQHRNTGLVLLCLHKFEKDND